MKTQTTTTTPRPRPIFLNDFTIYLESGDIYAHNEGEIFNAQDITVDDLTRLHSDLINELGSDRAGYVMEQLTANN